MTTAPVAYGLALPDLTGAAHLLHPARGGETPWTVRRVALDHVPPPVRTAVGPDRAVLPMGEGNVEVDRLTATTTFTACPPPDDAAVVHPYLAATAATVAWWQGRVALHAGAVVVGGRVWAVLGDRGAGKSTAMYSLVRAGLDLVADDVLVLDGLRVLPGPRCVDLRRESAEHYGAGQDIGVVGRRRRWRVEVPVQLPPGDLELAGLVHLGWADAPAVQDVPLPQRWPALTQALALRLPPADERAPLRLLSLPTVRLLRPRRLEVADDAARLLAEHLLTLAGRGAPRDAGEG
ncbi:hypothetical protein [Kineococcus aurantiacus]|uniref:Hpr(Ser) kinase/phosphatase n=1 Tax=Kineococcus aurantiacus TaxID=37633 RepID=A0A7Y9AVP1_9ACTN|nr:hypothetical protein [Kineococcus aurantiacus]NYD21540.1 hypothetical protein [Kineococcus aurantiacus]